MSKPQLNEQEFYEEIVQIPHYSNYLLNLLDKEDEEGVVEDNFKCFQDMYRPILREKFSNLISVRDNGIDGESIVEIDKSQAALKYFAMEINDNVYKNIDGYSVLLFDEEHRYRKQEFSDIEQSKLVD